MTAHGNDYECRNPSLSPHHDVVFGEYQHPVETISKFEYRKNHICIQTTTSFIWYEIEAALIFFHSFLWSITRSHLIIPLLTFLPTVPPTHPPYHPHQPHPLRQTRVANYPEEEYKVTHSSFCRVGGSSREQLARHCTKTPIIRFLLIWRQCMFLLPHLLSLFFGGGGNALQSMTNYIKTVHIKVLTIILCKLKLKQWRNINQDHYLEENRCIFTCALVGTLDNLTEVFRIS